MPQSLTIDRQCASLQHCLCHSVGLCLLRELGVPSSEMKHKQGQGWLQGPGGLGMPPGTGSLSGSSGKHWGFNNTEDAGLENMNRGEDPFLGGPWETRRTLYFNLCFLVQKAPCWSLLTNKNRARESLGVSFSARFQETCRVSTKGPDSALLETALPNRQTSHYKQV